MHDNTKKLIEEIKERAPEILMKDGRVGQLGYVFDGNTSYIAPLDLTEQNLNRKLTVKEKNDILRRFITLRHASELVYVAEIWTLIGPSDDEIPTGSIAEHPNKKEAIMIYYQSRDGESIIWLARIKRSSKGLPSLEEFEEIKDLALNGIFDNLFIPLEVEERKTLTMKVPVDEVLVFAKFRGYERKGYILPGMEI